MDVTVKVIKENKDGSADAIVNFDKEGLEFLVQEGLLALITQFIKQNKNAQAGIKMRKKLTTKKEKKEKKA
jgi:hypothetical protein